MARVPYVTRDELDAEGQEIYDRIRRDRNAPEVGLQFRALLHSPKATGYLTSLGAQLRFQSAMPENLKELAIILIAREWNSAIEWTGHAVLAAHAGVSARRLKRSARGRPRPGSRSRSKSSPAWCTNCCGTKRCRTSFRGSPDAAGHAGRGGPGPDVQLLHRRMPGPTRPQARYGARAGVDPVMPRHFLRGS